MKIKFENSIMSIPNTKTDFLLFAPKVSYTVFLCPPCRRRVFEQKTIKQIDDDLWDYGMKICTGCKDTNKDV
jgi:hypothetical protein